MAAIIGIRLCDWGTGHRHVFAEIGVASGRAELPTVCLPGKRVVPGHAPTPAPGPRSERTRKSAKAVVPSPLKSFRLDAAWHLVIPSADEIDSDCPSSLTQDRAPLSFLIKNGRASFHAWRPASAGAAVGAGGGLI